MTTNIAELKTVTNLDYLIEMSKGNKNFLKEMINTFLEENPKEVEVLEKAIQSKNFEDIKQAAHCMQSSIPFVGLDKIIESEVYEIEKLAVQKISLQKISELFSKVKKVCETARNEISKPKYLEQRTKTF